jgi:hypothetical protein
MGEPTPREAAVRVDGGQEKVVRESSMSGMTANFQESHFITSQHQNHGFYVALNAHMYTNIIVCLRNMLTISLPTSTALPYLKLSTNYSRSSTSSSVCRHPIRVRMSLIPQGLIFDKAYHVPNSKPQKC